jgi:hypothetical protein
LILDATAPSTSTASPITGTVVRWRIKGATATPGYEVNVVRKSSDGTYTVTASSGPVTPLGTNVVETFATALSIQAGEYVEWNIPNTGGIAYLEARSIQEYFRPALGLGLPVDEEAEEESSYTMPFNADVETRPVVAPAPVVPPAPAPTCKVPKLKGKKLKSAKKAIKGAMCKLGKVIKKNGVTPKTGKVVKQSPKAGASKGAGSMVNLTLG